MIRDSGLPLARSRGCGRTPRVDRLGVVADRERPEPNCVVELRAGRGPVGIGVTDLLGPHDPVAIGARTGEDSPSARGLSRRSAAHWWPPRRATPGTAGQTGAKGGRFWGARRPGTRPNDPLASHEKRFHDSAHRPASDRAAASLDARPRRRRGGPGAAGRQVRRDVDLHELHVPVVQLPGPPGGAPVLRPRRPTSPRRSSATSSSSPTTINTMLTGAGEKGGLPDPSDVLNPQQFIAGGAAALVQDSNGKPWNGDYVTSTGRPGRGPDRTTSSSRPARATTS